MATKLLMSTYACNFGEKNAYTGSKNPLSLTTKKERHVSWKKIRTRKPTAQNIKKNLDRHNSCKVSRKQLTT